jgi:hypothetical protein
VINLAKVMKKLERVFMCLSVLAVVGASNICGTTCRCLDYEADLFIVNCNGYSDHVPDIDFALFEWPSSPNRSTKAFFNNMAIHLLPK